MMFKHTFTLISIFAFTLTSWAYEDVKKTRWYQVNLSIFKQKKDISLDESYGFKPLTLDMGDIIQLRPGKTPAIAQNGLNAGLALHHENLDEGSFTLQTISDEWTEILNKLDPVNQPILYNAQWVQPIYGQSHAIPIYIESSSEHLETPQLRGMFYLHVSRYLHAKLDVQYLPDQAQTVEGAYAITQTRRMRSKELHYLDHPGIGALIEITPVEHPLSTDEEDMNSPDTAQSSALNDRI